MCVCLCAGAGAARGRAVEGLCGAGGTDGEDRHLPR